MAWHPLIESDDCLAHFPMTDSAADTVVANTKGTGDATLNGGKITKNTSSSGVSGGSDYTSGTRYDGVADKAIRSRVTSGTLPELAAKVKSLRSYGMNRSMYDRRKSDKPWYYEIGELGHNFRMSDILAAIGTVQMKKLDSFIAKRREIAEK